MQKRTTAARSHILAARFRFKHSFAWTEQLDANFRLRAESIEEVAVAPMVAVNVNIDERTGALAESKLAVLSCELSGYPSAHYRRGSKSPGIRHTF